MENKMLIITLKDIVALIFVAVVFFMYALIQFDEWRRKK